MELAKSFASPPPHQRPAKIRQSCDNCGMSKIKCGRQHPRCQSCLERGLACSYTPSRRSAKHSVASSEGGTSEYTENSASPQYHAQHITAAESSSSWSEGITDARDHATPSQKLPVIPGFEYNLNDDLDFNALCGSPTNTALLACMPDEVSSTALEHDATTLNQNTNEYSAKLGHPFAGIFSPVPNYPHSGFEGIEPCSNHTRTCMVSALKILQALHLPPSVCFSVGAETDDSSSPQPRMTDAVLSTNREAVRLVSDMLECPCSLSSQVQLVLTIICGKLTAWYRAMVQNGYDSFDDSSSMVWSDIANNNHGDQTERVLHQPITVGGYSFDVTLEPKIRAQVVFSELQHVEVLIRTLSRRVEETKFGNTTAARTGSGLAASSTTGKPDETGRAETIYRSLSSFLHKQLQVVKAEISLILNGGHDSAYVSGQSSDLN